MSATNPDLAPVGPFERWQMRRSGPVMRATRSVMWLLAIWIVAHDTITGAMSWSLVVLVLMVVAAHLVARAVRGGAPRGREARAFEQVRHAAWVERQRRPPMTAAAWREWLERDQEAWQRRHQRRETLARVLRLRAG